MSTIAVGAAHAVDAIFSVEGQTLPREHAQPLQKSLCGLFPWLAHDPVAAVMPLKVVDGDAEMATLPRRLQLVLRVMNSRMPDVLAVAGREVSVAGCVLRLDKPHFRELRPHATLYAYKVASAGNGELAFMETMDQELARLSIRGERVCGKRSQMVVAGQVLETFSLMLHALTPDQSLRLQQSGLGPHRLLGCGVFVPHKSAAAV